jgi:transposase-like protein
MKKRYTPEEKVVILRLHLLEKEPVSKLCGEIGVKHHGAESQLSSQPL